MSPLLVLVFLVWQFYNVHPVGLIVGSECIPFESISWHQDTSNTLQEVGWIKVMSCVEGGSWNQFTIHRTDYLTLSSRTISIKFQPPDGTSNPNYNNLAVIAKPYSSPIQYALRNNKEVSYSYDSIGRISGYASTNNWIGTSTALARLNQICYGDKQQWWYPSDFRGRIYHACGNQNGLHILPNLDNTVYYQCSWDNSNNFGEDIEIYFGFVPEDCDTYSPSKTPTKQPSVSPTEYPTEAPTNIPSRDPTNLPTDNPSTNPTGFPSLDPTISPTNNPSVQPSETPSTSPITHSPTIEPTTARPTISPSTFPSDTPTMQPSSYPTNNPVGMCTPFMYITKTKTKTIYFCAFAIFSEETDLIVHAPTNPPTFQSTDGRDGQAIATVSSIQLNITNIDNLNLDQINENPFNFGSEIITLSIVGIMACCVVVIFCMIVMRRIKKERKQKQSDETNLAMTTITHIHKGESTASVIQTYGNVNHQRITSVSSTIPEDLEMDHIYSNESHVIDNHLEINNIYSNESHGLDNDDEKLNIDPHNDMEIRASVASHIPTPKGNKMDQRKKSQYSDNLEVIQDIEMMSNDEIMIAGETRQYKQTMDSNIDMVHIRMSMNQGKGNFKPNWGATIGFEDISSSSDSDQIVVQTPNISVGEK